MSSTDASLEKDKSNLLRRRENHTKQENSSAFSNRIKSQIFENYTFKSVGALFIMLIFPNFVMLLNYCARVCHGDIRTLWKQLGNISPKEFMKQIWDCNNLDIKFGFIIIFGYMAFSLLLMKILPGKTVYGPVTPNGNLQSYKDNGFLCYIVTMVTFAILLYFYPEFTNYYVNLIYTKFPSIVVTLMIFGFIFCFLLYLKGTYAPTTSDTSKVGIFFFDYYWGTELHPKIFGLDVKVFTNCRFGLTVWPLLIICFMKYAHNNGNLHPGLAVNVFLQLFYITKFFWWEAGYYNTLDIILDRAGFYICGGCIVFVPGFYTFSTYIMAAKGAIVVPDYYLVFLAVGVCSLAVNYWADYQKQIFRNSNGNCTIWGASPKFIEARYTDYKGTSRKNLLLLSGFWGISRHFNYVPELILAFSWCASSGFHIMLSLSYFILLFFLLLHRVTRDDIKCSAKYGKSYEEYKKIVRWKLVPYVY